MRNLVIKANIIFDQSEIGVFPIFYFWREIPPIQRFTRHAQTNRLSRSRLQIDKPNARVGLVGLVGLLSTPERGWGCF